MIDDIIPLVVYMLLVCSITLQVMIYCLDADIPVATFEPWTMTLVALPADRPIAPMLAPV